MKRLVLVLLVLAFLATPATAQTTLRFDIIVKAQVDAGPPKVYGMMLTAPYVRVLPSGAIWLAGDRDGYKGVYGFLKHEGVIVGRFTFAGGYQSEGGQTTQIIDRYMGEGVRWYDGTLVGEGFGEEINDFPRFASYGPRTRPSERPTILFLDPGDAVLETRDYKTQVVPSTVTFNLLQVIDEPFTVQGLISGEHTVYQRIVVGIFYQGKEAVNVYYDILVPGYSLSVDLEPVFDSSGQMAYEGSSGSGGSSVDNGSSRRTSSLAS